MKITVCIKQVPDPETPSSSFKIDTTLNTAIPAPGVAPVVDPYAENAVEQALLFKDSNPDCQITVVCLGEETASDALKHALSMGCDEAVLVSDPLLNQLDSYVTSRVLAAAVEKIGDVDLVLCGRQASDDDMGIVPLGIAEFLNFASTTIAMKADLTDDGVRVHRLVENGYDVIDVELPAVVSISNEIGQPRYPTLKGIMGANKKPLRTFGVAELALSEEDLAPKIVFEKLFIPERDSSVELIGGDSPQDAGAALAQRLREEKLI